MTPELLKAILSMDSYNRGYGAGISNLGGKGTQIGNATIGDDSSVLTPIGSAQAAGFYAIAYNVGGEVVISYRGTDNMVVDGINGWGIGLGSPLGAQAKLAFDFYNAVAGGVDPRTANISLTGHSLGGGIAGLVGAVYGKTAVMFDNMPFETAASKTYEYAINPSAAFTDALDTGADTELAEAMAEKAWQLTVSAYGNVVGDVEANQLSELSGYYIDGEFLETARAATGQNTDVTKMDLGQNVDLEYVDNISGQRHNMALLVMNMYAKDITQEWKKSAQYFMPNLFNKDLAEVVYNKSSRILTGSYLTNGSEDYDEVLRTAIAYSAIDSGQTVFGNTGIKALYNDANNLGKAIDETDSKTLELVSEGLSQILVQYAGQLALGKVEGDTVAHDGVLAYDSSTEFFYADFGETAWKKGVPEATDTIVGRQKLLEDIMAQGKYSAGSSVLNMSMEDLAKKIEIASFKLTSGGSIVFNTAAEDPDKYSMLGTTDGADMVWGSSGNDIIFAGSGDDTISHTDGKDVVVGGAGTDTFDMSSFGGIVDIKSTSTGALRIRTEDGTTELSGTEKIFTGSNTVDINTKTQGLEYYLGSGDANVSYVGSGTKLQIGQGKASINVCDNVRVIGAKITDNMFVNGILVSGAVVLDKGTESGFITGAYGIRYGINVEGDLVIKNLNGDQTLIANYAFGDAGIYVGKIDLSVYNIMDPRIPSDWQQGHFEVVNALVKAHGGKAPYQGVDPLVLDLNDDGLAMNDVSDSTSFDMNGNGFVVNTGWVRPSDGLLVMDKNSNGQVDDIGELFGDSQQDGFAALAVLDQNADGVVDASDQDFAQLQVWRDLNGNGISEDGELQTLTEAGIASISTTGVDQNNKQIAGNQILSEGTFTRTDGTTGTASDVSFHVDNFNTTYLGDKTVSADAALMPNLKGFGTLTDLHVAMTQDPTLITDVQNGMAALNTIDLATLDLAALRDAATPILTAWADSVQLPDANGVLAPVTVSNHSDVPLLVVRNDAGVIVSDFAYEVTDQDGTYWKLGTGLPVVDAQDDVIERPTFDDIMAQSPSEGAWERISGAQIDFLERYTGDLIPLGGEPDNATSVLNTLSPVVNLLYSTLNIVSVALAAKGPLASYFTGIEYDAVDNMFTATTVDQLTPMYKAIFSDAPADAVGTTSWLSNWAPILDTVIRDFKREGGFDVTYAYRFSNIVAAYEAVDLATDLTSAAVAFGIPSEQIVAGAGNLDGTDENDLFYISGAQTASGGAGPDNYIVGASFDGAVIYDMEEAGITVKHVPDILRFASLKSTDVMARREGEDLIITDIVNNQSLTVTNHFVGQLLANGTGGTPTRPDWGVEEIVFSDGVVWDRIDTAWAVAPNTDGVNGVLNGSSSTDVLNSSRGNHTLSGGDHGDIYTYKKGNGHVTIEDNASDHRVTLTPDVVSFDEGVTYDDLIFSRDGNSNDLVVQIKDSPNDSLTFKNQFDYYHNQGGEVETFDRVEVFRFADGSYTSWEDIQKILITQDADIADGDIYGFGTADEIDLGDKGGHLVVGGNQQDTYLVGVNSGNNTIQEGLTNAVSGVVDEIIFGNGINPSAVQVVRNEDSNDVDLVISPTSTLTIKDQFSSREATAATGRIENFKFEDHPSIVWTHDDIRQKAIQYQIDSGTHRIFGFASDDIFDAGVGGDDYIAGSGGSDTYVFGLGYGHDQIEDKLNDVSNGNSDKVLFNSDVDASTVTYERGADINDLIIRLADGSQLDVTDMFKSDGLNRIESFKFQDAELTTLSNEDVQQKILDQNLTQSGHTVYGFHGGSVLDGYAGNNTLVGLNGNNTFIFGLGYGQQTVRSESSMNAGNDEFNTVQFDAGITSDMLQLSRNGDDVVISVDGHTDTLTLEGQFAFVSNPDSAMIEKFEFADGSFMDINAFTQALVASEIADPNNTVVDGYSGDDTLSSASTVGVTFNGNDGNDTITGGAGDDLLYGGNGNDVLDGGAGVDKLTGGSGNDTYIFGRGYGVDTINNVHLDNGVSTLQFNADTAATDVVFNRNGSNLEMSIKDTADKVVIEYYFSSEQMQLDTIQFADGTSYDFDAVNAMFMIGTDGNDTLTGTSANETFDGGTGDDTLNGKGGEDVYRFGRGYGKDTINNIGGLTPHATISLNADTSPDDLIVRRDNANNLVLSIKGTTDELIVKYFFTRDLYQVNGVQFSDGTFWNYDSLVSKMTTGTDADDMLLGDASDNILDGMVGDDTLKGKGGNDTYIFGRGYGADIINNHHTDSGVSMISLNADTDPSDVIVSRSGSSLVLEIAGTTDQLTVELYFYSDSFSVAGIQFADGTVWDQAAITDLTSSTSGDDTLTGDDTNNVFHGQAGNDTINGLGGDDTLYGGEGNDTLDGGAGNDTLDGGTGIDTLTGGDGNNTYIFGRGYGADMIDNAHLDAGASTLQFNADTSSTDVDYARSGNDLVISINGTTDSVTITDYFNGAQTQVSSIQFSDGTSLTPADINSMFMVATDGNDTLVGSSADDVLDGGLGNDILEGSGGNNTYVFGRGYGQDTIKNYHVDAGQSVLSFNAGVNPSDVVVTRLVDDLVFSISGTTDQVTVEGYFTGDAYKIVNAAFADGTTWNDATFTELLSAGTSGNDTLTGDDTNNIFHGQAGDDVIQGLGGDDTLYGGEGADYMIGGSGKDIIDAGSGDDTVVINGGDVQAGEILIGGEGDDKIVVGEINLSGVAISGFETLKVWNSNAWIGLTSAQMESFSTLTMEYENVNIYAVDAGTYDLSNKIVYGTFNLYGSNGDDVLIGNYVAQTIYAEGGNDIVRGGAGDDNLQGVEGNDDLYGADGNDILDGGSGLDNMYGDAGDDTLQIGSGHAVAGEIVDGGTGTDTLVSSNSDLSIVTIQNVEVFKAWDNGTWIGMSADQFNAFDSFIAQGGTANVWCASTGTFSLDGKSVTGRFNVYGTSGSDTLVGNGDAQTLSGEDGNDTIDGKGGSDWLSGGAGNDNYIYARGYGAGSISDSDWSAGNEDVLSFTSGVSKEQLWFEQSGNDLQVSIIGTSDSVAIKDWYSGNGNHIEKIQTADGSYLLDSAVQNMVNAMASMTPPGQTELPTDYATTLNPVITANWAA